MTDYEITIALCEMLGEIDGWAWRQEGPDYTPDEVGVYYGPIPADRDRGVGVRIYGGVDARDTVTWRQAQLRSRGGKANPSGADQLAEAAFARLHGLSRVGGISDVSRQSLAPLGADQNGREERTDNYIIILDNQEVP